MLSLTAIHAAGIIGWHRYNNRRCYSVTEQCYQRELLHIINSSAQGCTVLSFVAIQPLSSIVRIDFKTKQTSTCFTTAAIRYFINVHWLPKTQPRILNFIDLILLKLLNWWLSQTRQYYTKQISLISPESFKPNARNCVRNSFTFEV